jgi:sec-independent protein translocase protein TatA
MIHPLFGMPQGAEWLIILAIVILVFGAAKLPELARGTGQALRIFKTETKGLRDDEDDKPAPGATAELPPTHTETTYTETGRTETGRTGTNDLPTEPRSDKHPG